MLRISAPRIYCGHLKRQSLPTKEEKSLFQENESKKEEQIVSKYCFPGTGGDQETIVRMENSVFVDRIKRGGSDPNTADELDRVIIVLCEGYGSISMLGARHKSETFIGGAEMCSLACNSLLSDMQTQTFTLERSPSEKCANLMEAFQHCEERLQRALFDGSSRQSTVGESLIDGLYFNSLPTLKPILPSTIVSKTCEVVADSPLIRYVCQSGHKLDVNCGVCATVLDCFPNTVSCANVGGVLAAVFVPLKRVLPGEPNFNVKINVAYSFEWLTQSHTVNNQGERKRLVENHDTFVSPEGNCFLYSGSPCSPFRGADNADLVDANRYSRSLGRQTMLRKQGMTAKPSISHATLEQGHWVVVATSGFWRAFSSLTTDDTEDGAAKKIASLLSESKQTHCNDPNRFADLLIETAAASGKGVGGEERDNMTVVVLNKI